MTSDRFSSTPKYSCYEVSLNGRNLSRVEKEQCRGFFEACRVPLANLAYTDYRGVFRVCYYSRKAKQVSAIRRQFKLSPLKCVALRIKFLGRHDWFDKWKRDYHMRPFGKKFMIVPVWEKKKFKDKCRRPIFLEPGSAFGSGYHETTRLMVRLLETLSWREQEFLDIGTGTGILSIVADKLGAKEVTAFDFDKPSAIVAKKNFKLNGGHNGTFFCANLKKIKFKKKFAAVGANLLSKTLLECRKIIERLVAPGGFLILSGIGLQNLEAFQKEFSCKKLRCRKVLQGRKWAALIYTRV